MKIFISVLILFFITFCAPGPKVTRVSTEQTIDLSGDWNDTDSRLVSEEMIKDCLSRPWLQEFISKTDKKPRVIVGNVKNRSHEHINTSTFVADLEREVTNSGRVVFVASSEQREEIRQERMEQAEYASPETVKAIGREYGADYMLKGQINSILDEAKGTKVKYYQIELELINIETNEKVWIGQKKIKKVVERSPATW
ncbi:MAG TPA: penicillin-binding protein activator LpoB [bacterium]